MASLDDALIDLVAAESLVERARLVREATLTDIGLDSVDLVSIVFAVEEKYGIEIEEGAFAKAVNFGDFLDIMAARIESRPA